MIIPAAGSGRRMQKETPKPYLKIGGVSILEQTLRPFVLLSGLRQVVVATSDEYLGVAQQILESIFPEKVETCVISGGEERQHSIYNALQELTSVDLVLVHDAVRPFVAKQHIEECCRVADQFGAAVLGVPAKDTIKRVDDQQFVQETPNRAFLWQTQTPQIFRKELLEEAYEDAIRHDFIGTDDASLVERLGKPVKMVKGSQSNFKITYPMDLELAKLRINN
nr:2-C-methyl-D-erythritol 4-phosphate cytidylyltransferase [Fodinibius salsisoli]